jgi:hypothetical protein
MKAEVNKGRVQLIARFRKGGAINCGPFTFLISVLYSLAIVLQQCHRGSGSKPLKLRRTCKK